MAMYGDSCSRSSRPGAGAQLVADPVTLIFVGIGRQRAWERAWRLDSHVGIALRVSIVVEENDDTMITVKVGANTVEQLVPPWIQHRIRGDVVAPTRTARSARILPARA